MEDKGYTSTTTLVGSRPAFKERYEVLRILGDGAAGVVYEVRDRQNPEGPTLALKVLSNNAAFDEHTFARFRHEIEVCSRLNHPNLIRAYDYLQFDDTAAFTMELVRGSDLSALFTRRPVGTDEVRKIMLQVLAALDELHNQELVHRDVKMENILVAHDGTVKLTDLGLSKKLSARSLTKTGILLGTAQYLPPEYIRTSKFDARGDIYAAGIMLLELLSKERWVDSKNGNEAIDFLLKTNFAIPAETLDRVPSEMVSVIKRAMAVDPELRFQSAVQFSAALRGSVYAAEVIELPIETPLVVPGTNVQEIYERTQSEWKQRRSRIGVSLGATALSAGLITVLCLPLRGMWNGGGAASETIQSSALYRGTMTLGKRKTPFEAERKDHGFLLTSTLSNCSVAYVNESGGPLSCGRSGYQLELESVTTGQLKGTIVDAQQHKRYAIVLAADSAKEAK